MSPPKEDGPVSDRATLNIFDNTTSHHHATSSLDSTAAAGRPRQCEPLWRRRRAADECRPLASGHRDPWRPWRPEKLSEKQVDAAAAAAEYLLDAGMAPRFDIDTLRQLWRAGHADLVDELRGGGR
jgi:hypothetical protein